MYIFITLDFNVTSKNNNFLVETGWKSWETQGKSNFYHFNENFNQKLTSNPFQKQSFLAKSWVRLPKIREYLISLKRLTIERSLTHQFDWSRLKVFNTSKTLHKYSCISRFIASSISKVSIKKSRYCAVCCFFYSYRTK